MQYCTNHLGTTLTGWGLLFWSKAGDLLTPVGMLATEDGVYVAARGKIALLQDVDGDGRGG